MNKKLLSLLLTAAVMSAATLSGCGSGGGSSSGQASSAAKADVTLSVTFPGGAGAAKSLIPAGTKSIDVYASQSPIPQYYYPGMPTTQLGTLIATLTPAAPTATVKMVPGNYYIGAFAFDGDSTVTTRRLLSIAMSGGTIVAGSNSVELTFVQGVWTIKDAAGGPLTLSDGTVLNSMVIGGDMGQPMFRKGAMDYSKPMGSLSGIVRYRFNNNSSARVYGGMESQFNGTVKSNRVFSDEYNITRKCSWFSNYSCYNRLGDHTVFVTSGPQAGGMDYYQSGVKMGNAGTLLGMTSFNPVIPSTFFSDSVLTSGTSISGNLIEIVAKTNRSVSIKAGMAKVALPVKSASASTSYGNVQVTDKSFALFNWTGGTNTGGWQLYNPMRTSDGKTYYESGYLTCSYSTTGVETCNAGDYSFGLVPATTDVGEYCHRFDMQMKTCKQQKPSTGDVYYPWNFYDLNGDGVINYGSFKFDFHLEELQTYDIFKYLFTATGQ